MRETPAKVNLVLEVGALRPQDGRHELRTLFVPFHGVTDSLEVTPNPPGTGITLALTGRAIPGGESPEKNLACRALSEYCRAAAIAPDFHLALHKRIPICAGLGGGSSDAAATLLEINELQRNQHGTALPPLRLHEIARSLGADVPFFLTPVPSLATGIGDLLTPVPQMAIPHLRVLYPGTPSPVAWAYQHWHRRPNTTPPPWPPAPDHDWNDGGLWNDLEPAVEETHPEITRAKHALLQAGATHTLLSGSGSAVLAVFPTKDTCENAHVVMENHWELY